MNTPDTEWEEKVKAEWSEYDNGVFRSLHSTIDFISSLLTSRDTYWKERVRKEVEGMDIVSTSYECGVGYRQAKHDILQALDNLK